MRRRKKFRNSVFGNPESKAVETFGEVFSDGIFVEAVHDPVDRGLLRFMVWNGARAVTETSFDHDGRTYRPKQIDPTIARELNLPTEFMRGESVSRLVADLRTLVHKYSGLPDVYAGLVTRFVLSTWTPEAFPAAPIIHLLGPESFEATQLLHLLRCLCRRAVAVTGVTAANLCSLPLEFGLTLVIAQRDVEDPLENFFITSRRRGWTIPRSGRLVPAFCPKVLHCPSYYGTASIGAVSVPVEPAEGLLPVLDFEAQAQVSAEFQPRLLGFRFGQLANVINSDFDCRNANLDVRESVNAFVAVTPGCPELHAEVLQLISDQEEEARDTHWTDPTIVLVETVLLSAHAPELAAPYVGKITDGLKTLLSARGMERDLKPNQVGRMLRNLGLKLAPRTSSGVKLIMDEAARRKIHDLAKSLNVPSLDNPVAGCPYCAVVDKNAVPNTQAKPADEPEYGSDAEPDAGPDER
jgi:hypothetical protein